MTLVGRTIRSITLAEPLGSGGMGEVYLGHDERLHRRVAVKVIRDERRSDARSRARFLREARILSQIEHPNICRLYEFIDDEEADLIVMELVQGRSLRDVINDGLPFAAKLGLALQITEALAAAHAMSVVHRDLKPDNIMVTADGVVKILDFGLARPEAVPPESEPKAPALAGVAAPPDGTLTLTELGNVMGTPRYMSPEQARGEPVTAASDVYSLGLVLHELFTGRPPFDPALPRAILLRKVQWGDSDPTRGTDPHLAALVERLKSLAPQERPSAQATAVRLRWIAGKPRRRWRRLTAAAVGALVLAAAVVSTVGFLRARRAQARAEASEHAARQAQAQAEAVNSFLRNMLASADPAEMGIDVKVVEVLDRAVARVDSDLADQPLTRAAVLDTLGSTFRAIGEYDRSQQLLSAALEARRREAGLQALPTLDSLDHLGAAYFEGGKLDDAESVLRETWAVRREVQGEDHPDTLSTLVAYGRVLQRQRKFEEAETAFRTALDTRARRLGPNHIDTLRALLEMASIHTDFRRWDEAQQALDRCREGLEHSVGPLHPDTLAALHSQGVLYARQGRWQEAEAAFRETYDRVVEVHGDQHPRALRTAENVALCRWRRGAVDEAEALLRRTVAVERKTLSAAHPYTLGTMRQLSALLIERGRDREGEAMLRERYAIAQGRYGEDHRVTLETRSNIANLLRTQQRYSEAEPLFREILAARRRLFGEDHEATMRSKRDLAKLLRATGRDAEADALFPAETPE